MPKPKADTRTIEEIPTSELASHSGARLRTADGKVHEVDRILHERHIKQHGEPEDRAQKEYREMIAADANQQTITFQCWACETIGQMKTELTAKAQVTPRTPVAIRCFSSTCCGAQRSATVLTFCGTRMNEPRNAA